MGEIASEHTENTEQCIRNNIRIEFHAHSKGRIV